MKQTLNQIYHGIGYLLICIGWIVIIGMAGNSDLGMALNLVMRYSICGLLMMGCGVFLSRWHV